MKAKHTTIFFLVFLIAVLGLLTWRIFYLQRYNSEHYRQNSEKQQHSKVAEKPRRGLIVDRRGRILAASNEIETVYADPNIISDVKDVATRLQQILNLPGHEICGIIDESKNRRYVRIKVGITADERKGLKNPWIPGIGIQSDWQRFYPMGHLTSHAIGFVGVDHKGLGGIEFEYDSRLKGTEGHKVFFLDRSRQPIGRKQSDSAVKDGYDLILTLDTTIQQFARSALVKQYKAYKAESAVAIVMDPWTGAILAMVSLPDFDPVNIASCDPQIFKNRVITDPFEPGSVFKPIVAALALDAGVIDYDEKIFCENGDYHGKGFGRIGEFGNHEFADLTIRQILVESSNIGMAKIGQRMERQKLYESIKLFGFGARTGIDLPGEDAGLLYPPSKWTGYSVTRIPYGHEISVTAMQIVCAYSTFANGGRLVTPHLLKAILDSTGKITELKQHQTLAGYIIKPDVAKWIVQDALTGVVNEGTGKKAALKKWQVFGKTGTANIAMKDEKGYDQTNYIASFAGGGPAENPEVVVLVSIRKPDRSLGKGYSGGTVAAPVVKEILEKTLTYLQQD